MVWGSSSAFPTGIPRGSTKIYKTPHPPPLDCLDFLGKKKKDYMCVSQNSEFCVVNSIPQASSLSLHRLHCILFEFIENLRISHVKTLFFRSPTMPVSGLLRFQVNLSTFRAWGCVGECWHHRGNHKVYSAEKQHLHDFAFQP
jgi:hypothetical protein